MCRSQPGTRTRIWSSYPYIRLTCIISMSFFFLNNFLNNLQCPQKERKTTLKQNLQKRPKLIHTEPAVSLSLNVCLHYDLLTTLQKHPRGHPPKAKCAQTVHIPPNRWAAHALHNLLQLQDDLPYSWLCCCSLTGQLTVLQFLQQPCWLCHKVASSPEWS